MLEGLMFTLLTGLLWSGAGAIYSRVSERKEGGVFAFLFCGSVVFVAAIWGLAPPAAGATAGEIGRVALVMLPAGVAGQAGFFALLLAMRRGSHGVSWCIAQSAMICPFAAGILVLGEAAGAARLAGMALLAASLALLAAPRRDEASESGNRRNFPVHALLAFALLGAQQTLTLLPGRMERLSEAALSWRVPLFSLCGLGWLAAAWAGRERDWRGVLRLALGYGALIAAGQWTVFRAIDLLGAAGAAGSAYPAAIGASIVFFMLYARFARGEKAGSLRLLGVLLTLAGILALSL